MVTRQKEKNYWEHKTCNAEKRNFTLITISPSQAAHTHRRAESRKIH